LLIFPHPPSSYAIFYLLRKKKERKKERKIRKKELKKVKKRKRSCRGYIVGCVAGSSEIRI